MAHWYRCGGSLVGHVGLTGVDGMAHWWRCGENKNKNKNVYFRPLSEQICKQCIIGIIIFVNMDVRPNGPQGSYRCLTPGAHKREQDQLVNTTTLVKGGMKTTMTGTCRLELYDLAGSWADEWCF